MNIAYHELINRSTLQIDPNKDVNEVCAIIRAAEKNGCVILGGGSPKNFYLQGQPTLWEVYGIPKGGNDYFIQITTDSVVWGGLSGATPAEAVSWGKVNPSVLPDTAVAYCDSTIAFPAVLRIRRRPQERPAQAQGAARKRERAGGRARDGSAQRQDREERRAKKLIGLNEWERCGRSSGPSLTAVTDRPRVYADANVPAGLVAFMRSKLGVGRVVRDRASRLAPRPRRRALPPGAAAAAHARHPRSRLSRRPPFPAGAGAPACW